MSSLTRNFTFDKTQSKPDMLRVALWYAKRNIAVFPAHTPIFDDAGKCVGCSCEEWKRAQPQYGPDYVCTQPGKCPRVRWSEKSTTDAEQIRRWWKTCPNANIGIDAGKSGLLLIDSDVYKAKYQGGIALDENTVVTVTGNGGRHNWYRQPEGKRYGNATGKLPDGIDVRGHGGYVIAPGSLHHSGNRYHFLEGHSPGNIEIADLPQSLVDALDAAQDYQDGPSVTFSEGHIPCPNLDHLRLDGDVWELIQNGAPKGERSEADWRVVRAMVAAGATDDEIRATFYHYAIGEKYQERGDKYLAHTISKARAGRLAANDPTLTAIREWILSPDCVAMLRELGIRRPATYVTLLLDIAGLAAEHGKLKVGTTTRSLAIRGASSAMSVSKRLAKLAAVNLLGLTVDPATGTMIDLTPIQNEVKLKFTLQKNCVSVNFTSSSNYVVEHRLDDAFRTYAYTYAIRRRYAPTVLLTALGESTLLVWAELEKGGGTAKELAERTGLTIPAVRGALKKLDRAGLLFAYRDGRVVVNELHPDAEQRLDERRDEMVTAGLGLLHVGRNHSDVAAYAHHKLDSRADLGDRERAKLEERRDRAEEVAAECFAALERRGINPGRVGKPKVQTGQSVDPGELASMTLEELVELDPDGAPDVPKPGGLRYGVDLLSEWVDYGREIWRVYLANSGRGPAYKMRQPDAGYTAEQIDRTITVLAPKFATDEWKKMREADDLSDYEMHASVDWAMPTIHWDE